MKTDNQEQIWDKIAKDWSIYRNRIIPEVARFLENQKGKIIDLGCGSGRNFLKKDSLEFYGVDFSAEMLKHAEQKSKTHGINAILFKSEFTKLPFKANFFNAAIYISTLHCIEKEEDRKKSLRELFRVLKKGGEAMITVWNIAPKKTIKNNVKEGYVDWKGEKRYYYFYDEKELINILKEVGFKIKTLKTLKNKKTQEENHSRKNIVIYVRK